MINIVTAIMSGYFVGSIPSAYLAARTRNPTFGYGILFIIFPFGAWLIYYLVPLIFFSIGLSIFVGIQYVPRLKEIHAKTGGNWHRVIRRSSLKERF